MVQSGGRESGVITPTAIPLKSWKHIVLRFYAGVRDDRVLLAAAGVTYYALMALVPALSALISVYGLFFDPGRAADHLASLNYFVPGGGIQIVRDQVIRLAGANVAKLGLAFVASLLLAVWSANAGMKAVFQAMNIAYEESETRGFFRLHLVTLGFTAAGIVILLAMVTAIVAVPVAIGAFGFDGPVAWLFASIIYMIVLALMALAVTALYRWGPNRRPVSLRWVAPGTLLTVVLVSLISVIFSWYTANFGSYDKTYGSLGALVGFMTWMWMSISVLIAGGELNSEIEKQIVGE